MRTLTDADYHGFFNNQVICLKIENVNFLIEIFMQFSNVLVQKKK